MNTLSRERNSRSTATSGASPGTIKRWKRQDRLRALLESLETETDVDTLGRTVSILTLQEERADTRIHINLPSTNIGQTAASSVEAEQRRNEGRDFDLGSTMSEHAIHLLEDLRYLRLDYQTRILSCSIDPHKLIFIHDPVVSGAPYEPPPDLSSQPNVGPYALHPSNSRNRNFLEHENWLFSTRAALQAIEPCGNGNIDTTRNSLLILIEGEMHRLIDLKGLEWERQKVHSFHSFENLHHVNTEPYFEAQPQLWAPKDAIIQASYILVLLLHLVYGLPRRASRLLLVGLRCIIQLTLKWAHGDLLPPDRHLLSRMCRDPQTLITAFNLEPSVKSYICCPECYALYDDHSSTPTNCTYLATPTSVPCNAKLWRNRNLLSTASRSPVRKYLHQSLKQWVGRLLSRPDISDYLDKPLEDVCGSMKDIFDGEVLRSFLGPDGKHFLSAPPQELRLIFSLNVDGFNPFQMKEGKQNGTSTAMYMVCLNLPPHLRYLPENVYLVGVIPGPGKPSIDQINHFLALLVDELVVFWDPGVEYSRSHKFRSGCRVHIALIPLVSDVPAARQVAGLGSHNHTYFCSYCRLKSEDIENLEPRTWPLRDLASHRRNAEEWRAAQSILEREAAFERSGGVRYSELLRLSYWDPIRYVVIDSMHDLYLGILKNHIREVWGINVDMDDDSAAEHTRKPSPPRPDAKQMAQAVHCLYYGSDSMLKACGRPALWHLCADRDLRRAGQSKWLQYSYLLQTQRVQEGLPMRQAPQNPNSSSMPEARVIQSVPSVAEQAVPDSQSRQAPTKEELEAAERSLMRAKHTKTLQNKRKDILVAMCEHRGLRIDGVKADLAQRLFESRELPVSPISLVIDQTAASSSFPEPVQSKAKPTAHIKSAIGRQTMEEFLKDRSRMELPSWVTAAPMGFGTTRYGKLSADQWKTVGTINLPVTLIRTWGSEKGRRLDMLQNFMEAVEAIEVIGLREINASHIQIAEQSMQRYLKSLIVLYKDAKILPNHHFALHLPEFLRLFGPVHSWRTFAFERFNHLLQSTNTNKNFGELEMTYMRSSCRAANLRPLLRHPTVREALDGAISIHQELSNEVNHGTRLDDILRASGMVDKESKDDVGTGKKELSLDDSTFNALLQRVNSEMGTSIYIDERCKVKASGVQYKAQDMAPQDSNIIFCLPTFDANSAGRIKLIFLHTRPTSDGSRVAEIFIAVQRLVELSENDAALDNFRTFKHAGGRLCYGRYHEDIRIIRPTDIICHFAKTPMDDLKFSEKVVHTLTLTAGHCDTVNCVSFSPDSNYLASGGDDNALIIWDVVDGTLLYRLLFKSSVDCILWHPGRPGTILVGCRGGTLVQLHGFSLMNNKIHEVYLGVRSAIRCLDYDLTTKCLAVGTGQEVHITYEHDSNAYSGDIKIPAPPPTSGIDQRLCAVAIQFHKNGKNLLVSYLAHGIVCWEISTRAQLWTITPPCDTPNIGSSALSPDGHSIIVYNLADSLQLYSVGSFKNQEPKRSYEFDAVPRTKRKLQVAYLHKGNAVVCGTTTGNVCIWETASGEYFQLLAHNEDIVQAIDSCQRGDTSYIATASAEKGQGTYIKIWRAKISRPHRDAGDTMVEALHEMVFKPLLQRSNEIGPGMIIFATLVMMIYGFYAMSITISWETVTGVMIHSLRRLSSTLSDGLLTAARWALYTALHILQGIWVWILETTRTKIRQFLLVPQPQGGRIPGLL
ncbi:hypothetical protein A0H81_13832 [Grifola frondosa]|uniref:Uncharacterized protein n=1 Tax=Grifola frondosa TaxID=5627 RepID=A0A1C7LQV6_GRIFR|nr:hypothetical protein A0H81_13832 [Grifola frondosa]